MKNRGAHIQVSSVGHQYRRQPNTALHGIDLQIEPGQCVVLLGRSGCGKSTLLHILCGLIRPSEGSVLIDGAHVTGPSPDWVMMFQAPSLYPWMTVEQNIGLGLRFAGRSREIVQTVRHLLDLVELKEFAGRNVQDLSGGQQQRVALARSLAVNPEVLLLDEPLSALDTFTRYALQRDIRRIARSMKITVVLVTHDINEAVVMADRVVVMQADPGRIHSELSVPLPEERNPIDPEFARIRADLIRAYQQAAGLDATGNNRLTAIRPTAATSGVSNAVTSARLDVRNTA